MKAGRLGALAVAALAMFPVPALAASTPSPLQMRAATADPVESDFVEALVGARGLEGAFDAQGYADSAATDPKTRASILLALQEYGFVSGYGRDFYKPRLSDVMEELLMVFRDQGGANASASTSRSSYESDNGFQSFFEPNVNQGAYGVTENVNGYYWAVIIFTKGNEMFAIERGSGDGYPTDQAVAQARRQYTFAPSGFDVSAASSSIVPAQYIRLMVVGGLLFAFSIAFAVGAVVYAISVHSRPRPVPIPAEVKP